MVGATVSRIMEFHSGLASETTFWACSPRSSESSTRIHLPSSSGSMAASCSKYLRTIVVKCAGAEYAPILATAADRCTTALSFVGREACAEVPCATTMTFMATFSLACTATYCTLPFLRKTSPPSFNAYPAANLSQYLEIRILMLASPPCSSSAVARKMTSRFKRALERFRAMNAARLATSILLSSMEPRPYKKPSFITAANGSTVHFDRSTPTTSMCATNNNAFDGSAIAELRRRATRALRPGARSSISDWMPSFSRTCARYFAVACSFPGGFVVLVRIRSISQPWASLATAVVSPMGDGLLNVAGADVPEDWDGGTCATSGKRALNSSAPTLITTCSLRFPLTNLLHFKSTPH